MAVSLLPMKCRKQPPQKEYGHVAGDTKRLREIPAVGVVGGLAGFNVVSFSNKSNVGTIFVSLKPWDDRKEKEAQLRGVIAEIQKKTHDLKEARVLCHSATGH